MTKFGNYMCSIKHLYSKRFVIGIVKQPRTSPLGVACGCFVLIFVLFLPGPFPDRSGHGVDELLLLLQGAVQRFDILQNELCVDLGDPLLDLIQIFFGFRIMYDDLDAELPPFLCFIL